MFFGRTLVRHVFLEECPRPRGVMAIEEQTHHRAACRAHWWHGHVLDHRSQTPRKLGEPLTRLDLPLAWVGWFILVRVVAHPHRDTTEVL